jgi:hypothetical protein
MRTRSQNRKEQLCSAGETCTFRVEECPVAGAGLRCTRERSHSHAKSGGKAEGARRTVNGSQHDGARQPPARYNPTKQVQLAAHSPMTARPRLQRARRSQQLRDKQQNQTSEALAVPLLTIPHHDSDGNSACGEAGMMISTVRAETE